MQRDIPIDDQTVTEILSFLHGMPICRVDDRMPIGKGDGSTEICGYTYRGAKFGKLEPYMEWRGRTLEKGDADMLFCDFLIDGNEYDSFACLQGAVVKQSYYDRDGLQIVLILEQHGKKLQWQIETFEGVQVGFADDHHWTEYLCRFAPDIGTAGSYYLGFDESNTPQISVCYE